MIRILLVNDQKSILESIKVLIGEEPSFYVVGVAKNGRAAIEQALRLKPDIVLLDLEMPDMNGITATGHILQLVRDTKIIVLTSYDSEKYLVEALQAGAKGYLFKDNLATDLKGAIHTVRRGFSQVESQLLARLIADKSIGDRLRSVSTKTAAQSQGNNSHSQTNFVPQGYSQLEPSDSLEDRNGVNGSSFYSPLYGGSATPFQKSLTTEPSFDSARTHLLPQKRTFSAEHRFQVRQLFQSQFRWILTVLCGSIVWSIPSPAGVTEQAWHLLAIFLATIVGFILKPFPMGAIALAALVVSLLTKTLSLEEGLIGFSSTTTWLTFSSYIIAMAIVKTGLATRIAYLFMSLLGKKTLFLSYGLLATDLILSPAMPSGNARSGGVIFPLVKSLTEIYEGKSTNETASGERIGGFLAFTAFQGTQITTGMFVTAMVGNPLMLEFAEGAGIKLDWLTWAKAAFIPGIISLLIMPIIVYIIYPPKIRNTPKASALALRKLAEMGKVSSHEWLMLIVFMLLLIFWAFGDRLGGIASATTALLGIVLLVFTGLLSWQEILSERKAWDVLIWFSTILTMATHLDNLGFIDWISDAVGNLVGDFSWQIAFLLLCVVYFYSGYFFVSKSARAAAMYPAFLTLALAVGTPPTYAALVLFFLLNLSGCLTHYSVASAPMYYSSGYVNATTWMKLGFILSLFYIPLWLLCGGIWWQRIGLI